MRLGDLVDAASSAAPELRWEYVGVGDERGGADPATTAIAGLSLDSREVVAGDLFCCIPGALADGHEFAPAAVAAGASALLVERPLALSLPQVLTTAVRPAMARLSCAFYADPSRALTMVAVTGTNGKTTTVSLLQALLGAGGVPCATIGTLTGERTTPEAPYLQKSLRTMADEGTRAVAMEVSSHALVQDRVTGTHFDVGVFTNLTPDHLDYHRDLEDYFAAKARLFTPELIDAAVINVDDPYGARLADSVAVPVTTVSRSDAHVVELALGHSRLRWRDHDIVLALPGLFNIDNALAAAATASIIGVDDATIARGLGTVPPVPGRFEVIAGHRTAPTVVVDYAHTPDGVEKILESVRAIAHDAPITVVFGCGGDRDRSKRPLMAAVAETYADQVLVTSDNPRSEDPALIIGEILAGFADRGAVTVEPDRRAAIEQAIRATPADGVVVIAGKGAETTQTIGTRVLPFDDRIVAANIIEQIAGGNP